MTACYNLIMILTVDTGNTSVAVGLFDGDRLVKQLRFATDEKDPSKWFRAFKKYRIDGAVVSSVVPKTDKPIAKAISKLFGIQALILNYRSVKDLIKVKLKRPEEIGMDRLVNVIAAKELHKAPLVIIDFGTATTFCCVDRDGNYLGGAISPGILLSRDILHERTAKLPLIELSFPSSVIGDETVSAMRSGLLHGYVALVEGMVKRFKAILGKDTTVIATGGLSKIIAGKTDIIDIVKEDLTLKGLNIIWHKTQTR